MILGAATHSAPTQKHILPCVAFRIFYNCWWARTGKFSVFWSVWKILLKYVLKWSSGSLSVLWIRFLPVNCHSPLVLSSNDARFETCKDPFLSSLAPVWWLQNLENIACISAGMMHHWYVWLFSTGFAGWCWWLHAYWKTTSGVRDLIQELSCNLKRNLNLSVLFSQPYGFWKKISNKTNLSALAGS